MQAILAACGAPYLGPIARALQDRNALASLWVTDRNNSGINPDKYRRCWSYHSAMKPFYHWASSGLRQRMTSSLFPLWSAWIRRQRAPSFDVAYAMMGHGTELFDQAETASALKVIDATSSHPTSYYGFWQRECDIWCPGERVPIPRWMYARCNRELERADLILCPSNFVRDSMLFNGIPEAKCVVSPYGVSTGTFTPRSELPSRTRFICVGAICLRKGQQYLFRAFEKVRQVVKDAELVCVGSYLPDFRREKRRWEGTFVHYENIPVGDLSKLLRESTAFVFPSNEEGFAKAVIEGMSSGLPVIATYQSGATTLVDDGVEGIIVPARDVEKLAAAMIMLATNRNLNSKMGRAAYERGGEKNTWDDFGERLVQICGEALQRSRK
jgi:glycosyltransferase involved in cell wall biosynthesis